MVYAEIKRDLFTVDDKYYLAHCISADCRMGAGIAVEFDRRFDLRRKLLNSGVVLHYPNCILWDTVFNLFTKEKYWNKPTYDSLRRSVEIMRDMCKLHGIQYVAMPRIGCGLDGLKWDKVRQMILDVFADTDVEILVCYV